jgi:dTDP-4-amino-4,6-dideoxygalactose transaminase
MSCRDDGDVIPVATPWLGDEEVRAAADAVASGWVAQGPRVAAFEQALAAAVGAALGVALSSCTAALHLALVVAGIRPGDDVVVPSLSFIATANAVRYVGATPVFADVDLATQNVTAETIAAVLTPATRAVIVVHQVGMPADLDAITALCAAGGITVIEDAACAIGSQYRGARIGSHSDLVAFSFHPRKVLTTGEGGMITTSAEDLATRLRRLREHGMSVSAAARHTRGEVVIEQYLETGFNYRMTDIQAAVGIAQLRRLGAVVDRRRALAQRYAELLDDMPVTVPRDPHYGTTNYQSYSVLLDDDVAVSRNDVLRHLLRRGISARRGIMAAHLEPAYAEHPHAPLPVTERLTDRTLILPLFHDLSDAQQDRVVRALAEAL